VPRVAGHQDGAQEAAVRPRPAARSLHQAQQTGNIVIIIIIIIIIIVKIPSVFHVDHCPPASAKQPGTLIRLPITSRLSQWIKEGSLTQYQESSARAKGFDRRCLPRAAFCRRRRFVARRRCCAALPPSCRRRTPWPTPMMTPTAAYSMPCRGL
jgi:hypothetical protein